MTTSNQLPARRRSTLGTVIAVFGVLVLAAALAAVCFGIAVVRSLRMTDATSQLREELLVQLDLPRVSEVEVKVPPWLVVLGRVTASISSVDPQLDKVLSAVRSGQVGVYQLGECPDRKRTLAMLGVADQQLGTVGWDRIVTVLEEGTLVAVYQSAGGEDDELDAFVIVLEQRELVMVSARGRMGPLAELASAALDQARFRECRF